MFAPGYGLIAPDERRLHHKGKLLDLPTNIRQGSIAKGIIVLGPNDLIGPGKRGLHHKCRLIAKPTNIRQGLKWLAMINKQ